MKKILSILTAAVLCLALMTGCSAGLKDGTYKAEYKDFDSHGWKDYVTITVSGGKITAVDFDSITEAGDKKSASTEYRENMEPVSKTYPEKFMKELEDQLTEKQDIKKIDTIAGATTSTNSFKVLATKALEAAKAGNSDTVVVENS